MFIYLYTYAYIHMYKYIYIYIYYVFICLGLFRHSLSNFKSHTYHTPKIKILHTHKAPKSQQIKHPMTPMIAPRISDKSWAKNGWNQLPFTLL